MSTNIALLELIADGATTKRSIGAQLSDVVNVRDYGATGDGTTDDSAAMQRALDAAFGPSTSPHSGDSKFSNKPVYIPAGHYILHTPLFLTQIESGFIFGDGSDTTLLEYTGNIPPTQEFLSTIANPAVFTLNSHGYAAGDPVVMYQDATIPGLPIGIHTGHVYYVISAGLTANTFEVSKTLGGSAVATDAVPFTVTIANPAVVTMVNHQYNFADFIRFATTGALPTGLLPNVTYQVFRTLTDDTFTLTDGIIEIVTTGSQSGSHTVIAWREFAVSIASPGVVTLAGHNYSANQPITITTTGALPTGLTSGNTYYVKTVLTSSTFTLSASGPPAGTVINTSGSQSGHHTITQSGTHSIATSVIRCDAMSRTRLEGFGLKISGSSGGTFCFNMDWSGYGFGSDPALTGNNFVDIACYNATTGIPIGTSGLMGSECSFINCRFYDHKLGGATTVNGNALTIIYMGCKFYRCGDTSESGLPIAGAIRAASGGPFVIVGCYFEDSINCDIKLNSEPCFISGCVSVNTQPLLGPYQPQFLSQGNTAVCYGCKYTGTATNPVICGWGGAGVIFDQFVNNNGIFRGNSNDALYLRGCSLQATALTAGPYGGTGPGENI